MEAMADNQFPSGDSAVVWAVVARGWCVFMRKGTRCGGSDAHDQHHAHSHSPNQPPVDPSTDTSWPQRPGSSSTRYVPCPGKIVTVRVPFGEYCVGGATRKVRKGGSRDATRWASGLQIPEDSGWLELPMWREHVGRSNVWAMAKG